MCTWPSPALGFGRKPCTQPFETIDQHEHGGHEHEREQGGEHAHADHCGAHALTGSGFIVLAATLSAVGTVPVAGLALILGIDRFMSEARALTNFIGNGVATLVVARWTGDLDQAEMRARLDNPTSIDVDEPEKIIDEEIDTMPDAR